MAKAKKNSKKSAPRKNVKKLQKKPKLKLKAKAKKSAAKKSAVRKTAAKKPRTPSFKIGVFGGTFNPIHYGHLNRLETVQQALNLDLVYLMPAAKNPLRANVEGPLPEARLEMLNIAADMLNQNTPKFVVRDDEIKRGGASYTIDTLKALKKERDADYHLVVGADQLQTCRAAAQTSTTNRKAAWQFGFALLCRKLSHRVFGGISKLEAVGG